MGHREEKKAATRAAMLEIAIELFRDRGVDNVPVREVAERAGVSLKTFYNYFPTKNAVLDEIALVATVGLRAHIDELAQKSDESVTVALEQLAQRFARDLSRDREFMQTVFERSKLLRADGHLKQASLEMYDAFARLLDLGKKQGVIRGDVDSLAAAEVLIATWMFVAQNWLVGWWKSKRGLRSRLSSATDMVLRGVAAT
ncbi:MAG: TetR/AcrR family transcriptional regulator [Proteobacteria bacterium]|nr:TetR/AcrR family transcriptional regulator [Pseudomonadota bacterium]